MNLDAEYVRTLIDYDPDTGICTWKYRPDRQKNWNSLYAGKRAGSENKKKCGYTKRVITIDKRTYREHRIIWLYMTGKNPPEQIDHINGDATDNRWCNLQDAEGRNSLNRSKNSNNKSGVTGVHWHINICKWVASVRLNGKLKHLGYFTSIEDAANVVQQERIRLGFSDRHGNDK